MSLDTLLFSLITEEVESPICVSEIKEIDVSSNHKAKLSSLIFF